MGWHQNGTGWDQNEGVQKVALLKWDTDRLAWVRATVDGSADTGNSGPLSTLFDFASASVLYVGKAAPGATVDSPVWRIARIDFDASGNPTAVRYADSGLFSSRWDQRGVLAY